MFENSSILIIQLIGWLPTLIVLYVVFDLIGINLFGKK